MEQYGLVGRTLGHSFSRKFFSHKFKTEGINAEYLNFELASADLLLDVIKSHPMLKGLNVTIPYKLDVIPLLDYISPEAEAIGAVNCIKIDNNKLYGYNTDEVGFRISLLELIGDDRPMALVLGTGGASQAICYTLKQLDIDYKVVSRIRSSNRLCYNDLSDDIINQHKLIINTTPLGTYPVIDNAADIPYNKLTEEHKLYDLVYNPPLTKFLCLGQEHGAQIMNGSKMLIGQAVVSWNIWHNPDISNMSDCKLTQNIPLDYIL